MLSIGRLGAASEEYYLAVVASGVEDYYLAEGEAPGRWLSDGGLELAGEVQAEGLRALLAGRDPHSDDQLVRGPAGRPRTPGFDLTFSAPKSVSLLYALGDRQLKTQTIAAHEAAVGAAIGYLGEHAAFLRRGRAGAQRVPAVGLVAAGFRHRASRAGDPALHTHVLVANLGQDDQGRFGALDSRAIYRAAKTAGYPSSSAGSTEWSTNMVPRLSSSVSTVAPRSGAPFSGRRSCLEARVRAFLT